MADHGAAARLHKRSQLRLLLDELRALRDVDYVIVAGVDRLTRNALDYEQIRFELELAGAELVIASEVSVREEVPA